MIEAPELRPARNYLTAFFLLSYSVPNFEGSVWVLLRPELCLEYSRQRRDAAAVFAARS